MEETSIFLKLSQKLFKQWLQDVLLLNSQKFSWKKWKLYNI